MTNKFLELLENGTLVADGAMGTMLQARGIGIDKCFDELNITNPAAVADIHREYIEAGAHLVISNTFGANRFKLSKHGLQNDVKEINHRGVELAKRVVSASFKDVLVAGDIGPLGVRIAPYGRVQLEEAREAFAEQIQVLADAGADLIVIETMSDLYEIREAINAAREVCDLPVVASITFTRDDRTLLGDNPTKVARVISTAGADVIGVNCSGGPAQLLRILKQMKQAVSDSSVAFSRTRRRSRGSRTTATRCSTTAPSRRRTRRRQGPPSRSGRRGSGGDAEAEASRRREVARAY
jgi:homocysteine S-methyltransferase